MLDLEEIKKLPAAERIKKLKELEEKMEKEKELAKSMINESISEIEKRQEIEVIIESESAANSYKSFFENLWKSN